MNQDQLEEAIAFHNHELMLDEPDEQDCHHEWNTDEIGRYCVLCDADGDTNQPGRKP